MGPLFVTRLNLFTGVWDSLPLEDSEVFSSLDLDRA
jgi:hypothetical protein